jgi:chitinase
MTPQGAPCRKGLSVLTYDNFIHAANTYYPAFGRSGSYDENKREIAAFLGQISQETSGWWQGQEYTWGLCFPEEVGCESGACTQYTNYGNVQYPPIEGRTYHGRGAIQITGNENYGQASEAIFNDKSILLEDPDLLVKDGVLAFRASLWFWMTEQLPKPSCHDVMLGNAQECPAFNRFNGFGMTTNIINGGIECQVPTSQKVENRVQYFSRYTRMLGTTTGGNLYCDQMNDYNSGACPE